MTDEKTQAAAARILRAHASVQDHEQSQPLAAEERRDLARFLVEEAGWSKSQIARHLGITRQRVGQILAEPPSTAAETTKEISS